MKLVRRYFSRIFGKYVFNQQKKLVSMRFAFQGLSGHSYYHYIDAENDINPARYIDYYIPIVKEYTMGIKYAELDIFFNKSKDFKTKEQYQLAHLAMAERVKMNLDTTLIYELMAVLYLRDEEENKWVDPLYIKQKAEDIKNTMRASGGVEEGFFLCPYFRKFLKSVNLSDVDWSAYTQIAEKNLEALEMTLNLILNSDQFKNIQSTPKK